MVENKNINSPNNMDTVGTEKLKILLEKDENVKERQPKSLSGPYYEVYVPDTYSNQAS